MNIEDGHDEDCVIVQAFAQRAGGWDRIKAVIDAAKNLKEAHKTGSALDISLAKGQLFKAVADLEGEEGVKP